MIASIKLYRFNQADGAIAEGDQRAWPLTVRAVGTNIPSEIFVYRAAQEGDIFGGNAFSCVACATQMYDVPANKTVSMTQVLQTPFFRTSQVELLCRSAEEANRVWNVIQEDVQSLLDNYNLQLGLIASETIELSGQFDAAATSVIVAGDKASVPTTSLLSFPPGKKVVVQPTPPNASYADCVWLRTDVAGGTVQCAYGFFAVADGGDDKWHSRTTVTTGGVVDVSEDIKAPGA